MSSAVKHYESIGMVKTAETIAGRKVELGVPGALCQVGDALEPDKEPGSVLMSFGDPALSTGLLLCPPKRRNAKLSLGTPPVGLTIVGNGPSEGAAGKLTTSPDGFTSAFVPLSEFEASLGVERLVSFSPGLAGSLD